jgi:hypothetical protein
MAHIYVAMRFKLYLGLTNFEALWVGKSILGKSAFTGRLPLKCILEQAFSQHRRLGSTDTVLHRAVVWIYVDKSMPV